MVIYTPYQTEPASWAGGNNKPGLATRFKANRAYLSAHIDMFVAWVYGWVEQRPRAAAHDSWECHHDTLSPQCTFPPRGYSGFAAHPFACYSPMAAR